MTWKLTAGVWWNGIFVKNEILKFYLKDGRAEQHLREGVVNARHREGMHNYAASFGVERDEYRPHGFCSYTADSEMEDHNYDHEKNWVKGSFSGEYRGTSLKTTLKIKESWS